MAKNEPFWARQENPQHALITVLFAMKIKTKLTLGVGLLFSLILILGFVGVFYLNSMKEDTENILVANYNSLEYAQNMLSLIELPTGKNLEKIEQNLRYQENNISEIGEKSATEALREGFNTFKKNTGDSTLKQAIKVNLFNIIDMNMQAIQRKSEWAKRTADRAVFWVSTTATLCFLIAFVLLVNLPSNIANPIKVLTKSIKQIAEKNYSERVQFKKRSEFGQLAQSFNSMAEKLEEYNNSNLAKIMMEKKRVETLINNMHDPVIGLDENLNVLFANEEAIKIAGLEHTEFIGQSALKIAVNNDLMRLLIQGLDNAEANKVKKAIPIKIYANNKEGYFEKEILHIKITPIGENTLKLIGHVILLKNITEYKELDYAKTNFIATVSHEFKTPIAAIKMSLQLLENKKVGILNEEQTHLVASIKEDTNRLLKTTSELLNITQVESDNILLDIVPCSPKELLMLAIEANKTQGEQKQIKFEISCPDTLPKVLADGDKTVWVLTNLISNAVRYSYENTTVFLNVSAINNQIKFAIKDTGQGIAPQYQNKIFNRYFRVPGTKKEGTGLGLAISKEFIEAQDGQITLESEFGAGSTFAILLKQAELIENSF